MTQFKLGLGYIKIIAQYIPSYKGSQNCTPEGHSKKKKITMFRPDACMMLGYTHPGTSSHWVMTHVMKVVTFSVVWLISADLVACLTVAQVAV